MSRKNASVSRLRNQLKKKRESLADQFDFKMYTVFHFKDQKKPCAVFEVAEVISLMTNNFEDTILKGVKDDGYSYESSRKLLAKDVVQLHAPKWQSMRKDVLGCTTDMDFFLWPRNDIEKIESLLFSRWKTEDNSEVYKPLTCAFEFGHEDYEKRLGQLLALKDRSPDIISNPKQSMFLWVDRQHLESQRKTMFKLRSICLYVPQDQLTHWCAGTISDVLKPYLDSSV